jgi:hypothetical protein
MRTDLDLQEKTLLHEEALEEHEREEVAILISKKTPRNEAQIHVKQLNFLREEAERKGETFNDEDGHPIAYWDKSLNHPAVAGKKAKQAWAISKDVFGE